ncbi:(1-3)-beta-glucanase [Acanthocystis turfacea Chlorella virus GM0701.1]|nr:(1-3)-beta-glucanase [Acanthocystis turfacea Chlorella virus GM0701.1]
MTGSRACRVLVILAITLVLTGSIAATAVVVTRRQTKADGITVTYDQTYINNTIPVGNVVNITIPDKTDTKNVLLWSDEFDNDTLDHNSWEINQGASVLRPQELQVYSSENLEIFDSKLAISALKGNDSVYTSGRVTTRDAWYPGMTLSDGRVPTKIRYESVITLPESGMGIFPAFWAKSASNAYGDFPKSGEIDIMETIKSQTWIVQGIHYGSSSDRQMTMIRSFPPNKTFSLNTFKFSADWYATNITFMVNDVVSGIVFSKTVNETGWYTTAPGAGPNAPFDAGFKIVLNIAVGGNWAGFPDDTTPDAATMFVEYVRVYADF